MVVAIPKKAGGVFASGDNLVAGVGKSVGRSCCVEGGAMDSEAFRGCHQSKSHLVINGSPSVVPFHSWENREVEE